MVKCALCCWKNIFARKLWKSFCMGKFLEKLVNRFHSKWQRKEYFMNCYVTKRNYIKFEKYISTGTMRKFLGKLFGSANPCLSLCILGAVGCCVSHFMYIDFNDKTETQQISKTQQKQKKKIKYKTGGRRLKATERFKPQNCWITESIIGNNNNNNGNNNNKSGTVSRYTQHWLELKGSAPNNIDVFVCVYVGTCIWVYRVKTHSGKTKNWKID